MTDSKQLHVGRSEFALDPTASGDRGWGFKPSPVEGSLGSWAGVVQVIGLS